MNLYSTLLAVHIASGVCTLLAAAIAILAKILNWKHEIHQIWGRVFVFAMTLIFLTALPMSLLKFNLFLLLVSIFSFYLTLNGYLYAIDRKHALSRVIKTVAAIMGLTGVVMLGYGSWLLLTGVLSLPVLVFAGIGLFLARLDWQNTQGQGLQGKARIAMHLTHMMAATIAAITAFLVNAVRLEGVFATASWLLPTVVLVPVLMYSRRHLLR